MKPYFREIMDQYQLRRDQAEREQKYRMKEIYDFIPRIKAIDKEIARAGMDLTKLAIQSDMPLDQALKSLEEKIKALKLEKALLLTENNVPLSFLEVQYRCANCKDSGYLEGGILCKCLHQELIDRAYKMSNLSDVLARENFSTFDIGFFSNEPFEKEPITPRENMRRLLAEVEGYTLNFAASDENLLFYGPTGQGKTFLCNCIAKALLDQGQTVVYQTAFNLIKVLEKQRFSQESQKDDMGYQYLFESDLLIIDDLGTEFVNTFSTLELFNVLNTRLLNKKKTVVSTNLSPSQLKETYSERISSRLFGHYRFLYFYGKDLRWEV
jgi:DNA replication protein DnaC